MIDFCEIYKKYGISESKIEHMNHTALISIKIAEMLKIPADKELLYNAAMLHDIGYGGFERDSDFNWFYGHQIKTKERLIEIGLNNISDTAAKHNIMGCNKKESILLGAVKEINLIPKTVESKIIAFADSFRPHFVTKNNYWNIRDGMYAEILEKYGLKIKAENRKKRLGKFLIKNGMDYKKLYEEFIEKKISLNKEK